MAIISNGQNIMRLSYVEYWKAARRCQPWLRIRTIELGIVASLFFDGVLQSCGRRIHLIGFLYKVVAGLLLLLLLSNP